MVSMAQILTSLLVVYCTNFFVAEATVSCPTKWGASQESGTCIKQVWEDKISLNWDDSRDYCQEMGGDLVKIINAEMQDYVKYYIWYGYSGGIDWIGMHYNWDKELWVWLDEETKPGYTEWYLRNPDITVGECAATCYGAQQKWESGPCDLETTFICEVPEPEHSVTCADGWTVYEGTQTCLKYVDSNLPWQDARKACQDLGADLVKIVSSDMEDFLYPYNPAVGGILGFYWIGINFYEKGGFWRWLDEETEAEYLPYDLDLSGAKPCAYASYYTNRMWYAKECSYQSGFLCEAPPLEAAQDFNVTPVEQ